MKRRLLAVTLVCALALSACSSDKPRERDRDDDDDESNSGFTRVVATETEAPTVPIETRETTIVTTVPETEAAPAVDISAMNAAYLAILEQYESELRVVEDVEYGAMPSVSLADITGDGVNELIIEYCADQENGWGTQKALITCPPISRFIHTILRRELPSRCIRFRMRL